MNLQPLYDVKERLEYAAIAGVSLLGEDFRLKRAAEDLKALAGASPVFGRIDAGLTKLLLAPQEARSGLLLDTLSLVDAVVYTQGKTGAEGELEPLSAGNGTYHQISYGQIQPLITALTTTGGGRMETIRLAWEAHPAFFADFRVLPALIAGLGDSYGDIADQNANIVKQLGPTVLPLLKKDFDPAGKREMVRRVEIISALEGAKATPWLREMLPRAKKEVREAVTVALGEDTENVPLLLDLAKTERGGSRDAVLTALAKPDGAAVQAFWTAELAKNSAAVKFLRPAVSDWSIALVTAGLRQRLEQFFTGKKRPTPQECQDAANWCKALGQKDAPAMLDFWRWADGHMEAIDRIEDDKGHPALLGVKLTDHLRETMLGTGSASVRDLCMELWEQRPAMTRYLFAAFQAALLCCPAAQVYDRFSPYILTKAPILNADHKKTLNTVLLRALGEVSWDGARGCHLLPGGRPTLEPLDARWIGRLTQAVQKGDAKRPSAYAYWESVPEFDLNLMRLADPADAAARELLVPYFRKQMEALGQPYAYSNFLFQLGGSPRGVLGKAMARDHKSTRLGILWQLMHAAAQALPPEEVIALLEEVQASGGLHTSARASAEKIIPWTVEQLRAGNPFPDWDDWLKIGK